jgi:amino acid permease
MTLLVSQGSYLLDSEKRPGASMQQTILNLMKTCMGTGCLGLAYACAEAGIVVYSIGLFAIVACNIFAVQRLCLCLSYLPEEKSISDAEKIEKGELPERLLGNEQSHPNRPPKSISTLGKVAWYAFGRTGLQIMDGMMIVLLFGIIVAYISAGITFLADTPLSLGRFIDALGTACIMAVIALVPDIGYLSTWSAIGLSILAVTFTVIAGYGVSSYDRDATSPMALWPDSVIGLSHFFGICSFGFGVVPIAYNFHSSMAEPDRMVGATGIALSLVAVSYIIAGIGLYACYPDVKGEVLHELPEDGILPVLTRLAMVFVVFMTAPLLIVPCGELFESKWQTTNHVAVRFGICLVSAVVAVLLPSFVQVLSLVGCACIGLVGFCIPPLLHLRLSSRSGSANRWSLVVDGLLLTGGVAATAISTVNTLGNLTAA